MCSCVMKMWGGNFIIFLTKINKYVTTRIPWAASDRAGVLPEAPALSFALCLYGISSCPTISVTPLNIWFFNLPNSKILHFQLPAWAALLSCFACTSNLPYLIVTLLSPPINQTLLLNSPVQLTSSAYISLPGLKVPLTSLPPSTHWSESAIKWSWYYL